MPYQKRIVFPDLFDLLHKVSVFFPYLRICDFSDCEGKDLSAVRTTEGVTVLFPWGGTECMTGLLAAGQGGANGDRCQTDHTFPGLGHHAKGSNRGLVKR